MRKQGGAIIDTTLGRNKETCRGDSRVASGRGSTCGRDDAWRSGVAMTHRDQASRDGQEFNTFAVGTSKSFGHGKIPKTKKTQC